MCVVIKGGRKTFTGLILKVKQVCMCLSIIYCFYLNNLAIFFKIPGQVHGVLRRSSSFNTGRIEHLYQNPQTHTEGSEFPAS